MLQQTVEETPAPCIPLELDRIPGLSSSADPDVPLVEALKARTAAAFDELVKQFENRLLNVAMKITKNREDAEDVVQEAFLKVFKNIDGFRAGSKFSTWLIRIVINQALMLIRGNPQKLVSIDEGTEGENGFARQELATGSDTPEQLYAQREFEGIVLNLAHVRESSRRVMDLSINQNLSDIEISQVLSLTLPAVKARLYRGRLDLREAMGRHFRATKFDQTREDAPATTARGTNSSVDLLPKPNLIEYKRKQEQQHGFISASGLAGDSLLPTGCRESTVPLQSPLPQHFDPQSLMRRTAASVGRPENCL